MRVLNELQSFESVEEWWEKNSKVALRVGEEVLGRTTERRPPVDEKM